ncbi:hypothetical protein PF005_g20172 [Phytophthora fragariae]|nr:hypothetical protein PF009_g5289 [Phytophthora fragariae]KAE9075013.1 hypothetical protein PF007_g25172 [Phytophthora fragariae]KAE9151609.1 hypothetical protein PF006_g4094 [Phytophthora fragariae]KAE9188156.1 hypothetical protein PF005_g20172 [Phytophthora fragariae]KAE9279963.1 hypothetical protein PF001_g24455 [Phytophthora fragariae]
MAVIAFTTSNAKAQTAESAAQTLSQRARRDETQSSRKRSSAVAFRAGGGIGARVSLA